MPSTSAAPSRLRQKRTLQSRLFVLRDCNFPKSELASSNHDSNFLWNFLQQIQHQMMCRIFSRKKIRDCEPRFGIFPPKFEQHFSRSDLSFILISLRDFELLQSGYHGSFQRFQRLLGGWPHGSSRSRQVEDPAAYRLRQQELGRLLEKMKKSAAIRRSRKFSPTNFYHS